MNLFKQLHYSERWALIFYVIEQSEEIVTINYLIFTSFPWTQADKGWSWREHIRRHEILTNQNEELRVKLLPETDEIQNSGMFTALMFIQVIAFQKAD